MTLEQLIFWQERNFGDFRESAEFAKCMHLNIINYLDNMGRVKNREFAICKVIYVNT